MGVADLDAEIDVLIGTPSIVDVECADVVDVGRRKEIVVKLDYAIGNGGLGVTPVVIKGGDECSMVNKLDVTAVNHRCRIGKPIIGVAVLVSTIVWAIPLN